MGGVRLVPVGLGAQLGVGEGEVAQVAGDRRDGGVLQRRLLGGEGRHEGVDLIAGVLGVIDVATQRQGVPHGMAGDGRPVTEQLGGTADPALVQRDGDEPLRVRHGTSLLIRTMFCCWHGGTPERVGSGTYPEARTSWRGEADGEGIGPWRIVGRIGARTGVTAPRTTRRSSYRR
ncbi:hypothetical protein SXIM_39350 [Streptomyces xiamenensis]|uniref:Uncharacterized protein n=1 Tax=Streptomyces xiamenensis TaxID=408015 RepID=A0A0F7FYZ5_9ACTN|nr:hypothetical protein SXIM_39350 [Streptomyces xiamenensis]